MNGRTLPLVFWGFSWPFIGQAVVGLAVFLMATRGRLDLPFPPAAVTPAIWATLNFLAAITCLLFSIACSLMDKGERP